ncbi:sarcosine oxidase subunit alpha [Pseudahrensia aquimaris]|uniref:Sarcosine oxidase subunit alpha n=1 Tax=Pseudahrensia aquimaris TaxID=744461 RepID=A0ABW3FEW0_9HYPH
MTGPFRIPAHGLLDRNKTVQFSFDGKQYEALEGDTVASALLAHGVHLMGRSFKYHRPRGIMAAGVEEPNALIGVSKGNARHTPNVRASVAEVFDGMKAKSQNAFPSLKYDIGAVNNLLSPVFVAGFYYKTFMWPRKAWDQLYEPFIRRAAGLGESPTEDDPDRYTNRFAHCDVLVVGMGAAGLTAALEAAKQGKQVIVCDEQAMPGGWLNSDSDIRIDGHEGHAWAAKVTAKLRAMDNVRVLTRTTAFGYFQQNMVALTERVTDHIAKPDLDAPRERLWQVRAEQVVIAQGGIERHMVFPDNDRPGIMLAGAAQTYCNKYGVIVGSRIGVFASCDTAYAAAFDLYEFGASFDDDDDDAEVVVIVDTRDEVNPALLKQAEELGIEVITGAHVTGTKGRLRIKSMTVEKKGSAAPSSFEIDTLIHSAGWTPSLHLYSQSRGKPQWHEYTQRFLPGESPQNCVSIGLCNGTDTVAESMAEAAKAVGAKPFDHAIIDDVSTAGGMIGTTEAAGPHATNKAFVDFQNDVTAKDIRLAVREGMHSIEHVKRYTTNGMATDQGKLSNMHGLAIAADMLDKPVPQVGLTTFRAPYTPTTFGTFANHSRDHLFDPRRKTPIHEWAEEHGAAFEPVSLWDRAWYFPRAGEGMHEAVDRECQTVRKVAGVFDASTLGKIEIVGPDAAAFMDKMYTNGWSKLKAGRAKYGIMLREDGFIYDDGVVGKLADDRFHVTTTTGGAPRVMNHMEDYLQTEFPEMKVWLTSTTEQWATIAVQGPKAREIIEPLVEGADISNEKFPHMSVVECKVCGVPARLFRISFTGELGFEINVPADYGRAVWEAVWARAEPMGACVYGTETMHVLRAEKGYIIVGQDTDGTVTPFDAGLGWAVAKSKPDYVGKRGLQRPDLVAEGRRQLVGLKTKDPKKVLEEGAQIVADPNQPIPMKMLGFVTSSYWSGTLGQSIAMALVEDGFNRMGKKLYVPMPDDEVIEVEVTGTVFYDEEGERLHG